MTLKDHSAQSIFDALMLDPDLEIGEGQTREEVAKHEAEYRAKQHYNNMRALSLGTDDSSLKALLDFVASPAAFLSNAINIVKASLGDAINGQHWGDLGSDDQNPHGKLAGKDVPDKVKKFLSHLGAGSEAARGWVEEQFAPAWEAEHLEDPHGWVDAISHGMGTHPDHNSEIQQHLAQYGLDANQQQKMSENVLYKEGFNTPSPMPKNPTHNKKMFNDGRYGTNTKDHLEEKADITKLNAALEKMGRKERLTFGSGASAKLKFDDSLGNVKQWESYTSAPDSHKRVRINHSHISPDAVRYQGITQNQLNDYSVAEVLRGFFHHRDKDNGAHDVTPEQQDEVNAISEENESQLDNYDDASPSSEDLISQNPTNMEEINDDEFDFVFKSPGVGKYESEKFDTNLPIKLMHHDHDHIKGIAQQYGMSDARGYITPAHVKGIHDAIKAGQLSKGNIIKATSKSTGSPYYVLTNKAKEHLSGLHKYAAFHNGKPLMPIKAAKKLVDKAEENTVSDSDEDVNQVKEEGVKSIPQAEINDALDPSDVMPVQNHPIDAVNHANALEAKLSEAFIAMGIAYDPKSIGLNSYGDPYDNASLHSTNVDDAWDEINDIINNTDVPQEAKQAANISIMHFAKNHPQFLANLTSSADNALFNSLDFHQWANLTAKEKEHAAHVTDAINASKTLNNLPLLKDYASLHNMNLPEAFANKSKQLAESVNAIKAFHIENLGESSALHPLALVHALEKHSVEGYSPASQAIQNAVGKESSIQDIADIDPVAIAKHTNQAHGSPENSNVIEQVMNPSTSDALTVADQYDEVDFDDQEDFDESDEMDFDFDAEFNPQEQGHGANISANDGAESSGWLGVEHEIEDFDESGNLTVTNHNAEAVKNWASRLEDKHNLNLVGGPTGNEPSEELLQHFGLDNHMSGKLSPNDIATYIKDVTGDKVDIPAHFESHFNDSDLEAMQSESEDDTPLPPEEEEPEPTEEETEVEEEEEPEPTEEEEAEAVSATEGEDDEPPSQVEEELDTVDSGDSNTSRQKEEVMNELFGRDQDSKEAQKYSKYLDKQKPEKIDSLHEKHVIGNIEKKAIQAKANKVKAKLQEEKDAKKDEDKAEANKVKEEEKAQKDEDKEAQKNADTVPHKASEIEKKIKDGQDPKQMARENMIHQHQNEDEMSDKAKQEHKDAFHKFESSGVDMDELMDEKDEHGESYGSEEHLQSAMDKDVKQQEQADHYEKHLGSSDWEHRQNREKAFRAGQPGKFTEFDEKGNPSKDLHHKLNAFGESTLEEHEHGKGPEAATTHSKTGEDLGTGTAHSAEDDSPEQAGKLDALKMEHDETALKHQQLKGDLDEANEMPDGTPKEKGDKDAAVNKIHQEQAEVSKKGKKLQDQIAEMSSGQQAGGEDDTPKTGPPDPEVAVKKQAEGYTWHEETRSWILKETMKNLNGSHGPNGATMMHGGSTAGTKPGQMIKPFASNEDGSPSDNHFVVSHAGVHKVTPPSSKPGSFSSNQHTTEAAMGHALKDVEPGPNGQTSLGNDALSAGGKLGGTGLGTADNHISESPKTPSLFGGAINDIGGAMDKLKGMLNLEELEEQTSSVNQLRVKYK